MPNLLTTALPAIRYPSAANNGTEFASGIETMAEDLVTHLNPCYGRISKFITATSLTSVSFNSEDVAVGGTFYDAGNPTRVNAPRTGVYIVQIAAVPDSGETVSKLLVSNGFESYKQSTTADAPITASGIWIATAGAYLLVSAQVALGTGASISATLIRMPGT